MDRVVHAAPAAAFLLGVLSTLATAGLAHGEPVAAELSPAPAGPLQIPHTEVIDLPRSANGIDYQLYVHVPPACRHREAGCATVYMLDAEYSFALAAQIVTHLSARDRIPPLISVAIGYPDKSQYRRFRSRDYTPYFHPTGGYGKEMQKASGGGPAFLDVIREEIVPFVEATYPASSKERTLVGHSYGGLFASYVWMWSPETFANYVIVSPSLWYAGGRPLRDAASVCRDAPFPEERDLYLAVGEYEEQPGNGRAMVSDLRRLQSILDDCASRHVATLLRVFEDETHASIFPAALSTALRKHFQ